MFDVNSIECCGQLQIDGRSLNLLRLWNPIMLSTRPPCAASCSHQWYFQENTPAREGSTEQ